MSTTDAPTDPLVTPDSPAEASPSLSLPAALRDRLRLLSLLGMVVLWTVPDWVQVDVDGIARWENGAVRTGVTAALALIALWGLSATSLASRTARGLRAGTALTDTAIAATTALLLLGEHAWIPGTDLREAWVPIFLPLALLGALDAIVHATRPDAGSHVTFIRGGAALFAAVALAVDASWIPACIALWLSVSALVFVKRPNALATRRALELLALVAAALAGLAPWIQRDLVGVNPTIGAALTWPIYVWCLLAALVVTTALDGVLRPEAEGAPAPRR